MSFLDKYSYGARWTYSWVILRAVRCMLNDVVISKLNIFNLFSFILQDFWMIMKNRNLFQQKMFTSMLRMQK